VVVLYCFVMCVHACACVCVFFGNNFWYCTLTEVFPTMTEVSLILAEVFLCFFLSCKANPRAKLAKTGHGQHSSKLVVICVVLCIVCV